MSSRPKGIELPGSWMIGNDGGDTGWRMYMYCRVSCGGIKAVELKNILCFSPWAPESMTFASSTCHPSAHSKRIRSNQRDSWVIFWMWTSRKTLSLSIGEKSADGDRGTYTFVLTDRGLVTYQRQLFITFTCVRVYDLRQICRTFGKTGRFDQPQESLVHSDLAHWVVSDT